MVVESVGLGGDAVNTPGLKEEGPCYITRQSEQGSYQLDFLAVAKEDRKLKLGCQK